MSAPRHFVDWGSNEGFFSMRLGSAFRDARVLSVEADVDEYTSVSRKHRDAMAAQGVHNNVQCNHQVNGAEFERVVRAGQCWDVQLALSVMHWFEYTDHDSFLERLGFLLMGARTTFLELPEARVYGPDTGQTRWHPLNRWLDEEEGRPCCGADRGHVARYGGVLDETELVNKAMAFVASKVPAVPFTVTCLGAMFHQTGCGSVAGDVVFSLSRAQDRAHHAEVGLCLRPAILSSITFAESTCGILPGARSTGSKCRRSC